MPEQYTVESSYMSPSPMGPPMATASSSSPSGGLACAIAALAEHQQFTGESSTNYNGHMLPSTSGNSKRVKKSQRRPIDTSLRTSQACEVGPSSEVGTSYVNSDDSDSKDNILPPPPPPPLPIVHRRWNPKRAKNMKRRYPVLNDFSRNMNGQSMVSGPSWEVNHGSEATTTDESDDEILVPSVLPPPPPPPPLVSSFHDVTTTSGMCSQGIEDHVEYTLPPPLPPPPPPPYDIDNGFQSSIASPIVPESFEEQMMLAMAASLAEERARTMAQGVAWY